MNKNKSMKHLLNLRIQYNADTSIHIQEIWQLTVLEVYKKYRATTQQ